MQSRWQQKPPIFYETVQAAASKLPCALSHVSDKSMITSEAIELPWPGTQMPASTLSAQLACALPAAVHQYNNMIPQAHSCRCRVPADYRPDEEASPAIVEVKKKVSQCCITTQP